jgi:hypothetical protein
VRAQEGQGPSIEMNNVKMEMEKLKNGVEGICKTLLPGAESLRMFFYLN